jgi:hypothetical protein
MASAHYNLALQTYTTAGINLSSDTIKVRLQRVSAYTFAATHTTMTSIGAGVGTDPTLGTKVLADGTFDAADSVWTAVGAGAAIDCLIIYKFVTNDAGSTPLAYIDGFSVVPNGGDITAVWQSTTPWIFKI